MDTRLRALLRESYAQYIVINLIDQKWLFNGCIELPTIVAGPQVTNHSSHRDFQNEKDALRYITDNLDFPILSSLKNFHAIGNYTFEIVDIDGLPTIDESIMITDINMKLLKEIRSWISDLNHISDYGNFSINKARRIVYYQACKANFNRSSDRYILLEAFLDAENHYLPSEKILKYLDIPNYIDQNEKNEQLRLVLKDIRKKFISDEKQLPTIFQEYLDGYQLIVN